MSAIVVKDHGLQESTPQTRRFEGHETRQAPISKLPEDVLLIIFMMLRDWDWRSRTMVTRITHVCQEWRYIAIGAPLLWTKALFSYHAKWTILALQRALTAPIEVDIDFMESKGVIGVSKTLLGHISHTSKLDLFGTYDHLDEAQKLMAEDDATQLKELDIRCIQSRTVESPRPFVLSPTTFRRTLKLRSLILSHVDIDFNSLLLRNLTTLRLQHISTTAVPTWPKLLEVLRAMPLLEDLKLEHVFPQSDTLVGPLVPVDLDSLRTLYVGCSTSSQIYIILGLVFFPPLPASLSLQWDVDDMSQVYPTIIFESIAKSVYAQDLGYTVGTVEVEHMSDTGRIKLWAITHGGPGLYIYFPENAVEIGDIGFIENFLDILCLANIIIFELKVNHEYSHYDLLRLTSRMPLVQYITVGHDTAFNFIDILNAEPLSSGSEPPSQVCLPKLEYITWAGGDFSEGEVWVDEVAVTVLSRRRERGFGVKTIEFNDVENLSPELVNLFEKGVTEVLVRNFDS